jgi:hypothetical protein
MELNALVSRPFRMNWFDGCDDNEVETPPFASVALV